MRNFTILFTLLFCLSARAQNLSLIAATGDTGHNLPALSYLTNMTPHINQNGDIAFAVIGFQDDKVLNAIFYKDSTQKDGKFLWVLPDGEYVSDLSLTDDKSMFFSTHDTGRTVGVYDLSYSRGTVERPFQLDPKTFSLTSPYMSNSGMMTYRLITKNGPRQIIQMDLSSTTVKKNALFTEGEDGISYVFSPRQAGDYILNKIRYDKNGDFSEDRPDRLWLINTKTGRRTLVAQDRDAMPSSKILAIENMYEVSANGTVAFWARTKKGRELFHVHNSMTKRVLMEGRDIAKADWFSPAINDNGSIVLRGVNESGEGILLAYSSKTLKWSEVVTEGDSIEFAAGKYIIKRRRALTFIGGLNINNKNQVVFNANTLNEESGERMEAIYLLDL